MTGGFRIGRRRRAQVPDENDGSTGLLVGSLLALFAFLLAVTMGMASDRYDARRGLVLRESNSIGTTFLRAGYLPEPERTEIRNLLRDYVPSRVAVPDLAELRRNDGRSAEIQDAIWARAEALARRTPDSDVLALFIASLNETIDLQNDRLVVGVYARVPATVVAFLLLGGGLSILMVGYNAGLGGKRSLVGAVVFIVVVGAVITLVIDLDRPRDGFVTVSQQALIDLQERLGSPEP
jgi:hypothetical protein